MHASLTFLAVAATALMVSLTPAAIAQTQNTQQDKMKACNSQAATQSLTGEARKSFMSTCLSGSSGSSSSTTGMSQQDKMKACNTQATAQNMTGNTRQQFMSTCLKGS
jgi:hypothetical protein